MKPLLSHRAPLLARSLSLSLTLTVLLPYPGKAELSARDPQAHPASEPTKSIAPADLEEMRQQLEALKKTVNALQGQLDEQKQLWNGFHTPAQAAMNGEISSREAQGAHSPSFEQHQAEVEGSEHGHLREKSGLLNPDISGAVDFITSYSKATDNVNFTLRDVELMVQANVDQYARAFLIFNAESELIPSEKTEIFSDVSLGVEEAAIETTSLPWGLQVKAGQFFANLTRLSRLHSHDLPFVDRPRSLDLLVGGEAQARGLELSWSPEALGAGVPEMLHSLRLTAGLVDNIGAESPGTNRLIGVDGEEYDLFRERENRPLKSLLAYTRVVNSWRLGSKTTLHLGANYARSSQGIHREFASTDALLEWRPSPTRHDQFQAGGELLWNKQSGRFSDEASFTNAWGSATGSGGYLFAQYRVGKTWQPGLRIDRTRLRSYQSPFDSWQASGEGPLSSSASTWTYSAYLTLHLSEVNRLRLQLNYVDSDVEIGPGKGSTDLQAFLQWTVFLGGHQHPGVSLDCGDCQH